MISRGAQFQAAVLPNGLTCHVHGYYAARVHDAKVFELSGLVPKLRQLFVDHRLLVYADSAYPLSDGLQPSFKEPLLSTNTRFQQYQRRMTEVRGEVEHIFRHLVCTFRGVQNWQDFQVGRRPIGEHVYALFLLLNLKACGDGGNQISRKFAMHPPTLRQYIEAWFAGYGFSNRN